MFIVSCTLFLLLILPATCAPLGWCSGVRDRGVDGTLAAVATPAPFDARTYLRGLVGQTIPTITGKPNTVVAVRGDDVFVRTEDTTNPAVGEPVPILWVQEAGNTLYANGRIGINTTEATHRSAFIGAVLSTLPGAVGLRRPARVELVAPGDEASALGQLEVGRVYTWEELADAFGFKPAFFSVAGGMVPSAATNSLLLITHPGGGKSFDYQDHWDGADLIYTGRGKLGNQQRGDARNLDVAENRRPLFVFEAAGPRRLLFRGRAVNVEERTGRAPDDEGVMRDVLLFRLRFDVAAAAAPRPAVPEDALPAERVREARPFRDELPRPPSASPEEPLTRRPSPPSASKRTGVITRSSAPSTPSCTQSAATRLRKYPARSTCGRRGRMDRA
jgi:hypothetical protein